MNEWKVRCESEPKGGKWKVEGRKGYPRNIFCILGVFRLNGGDLEPVMVKNKGLL